MFLREDFNLSIVARIAAVVMLLLSQSLLGSANVARADIVNQPTQASYISKMDGSPLFLVATNYEGQPDRSWKMWQDGLFDPTLIEQDFLKARSAGINALRIFIQHPLPAEIKAGKWTKLDAVVGLARKHNLPLIITFYDYGESDLSQVAAVDRLIAQRYANESAVLAYDLRNEPHFSDLAAAIYPNDQVVPLLTDILIKQYGEKVTQAATEAWRQTNEGRAIIPARLSPTQAYHLANNYRIYLDFLSEAGAWVAARSYEVSVLDYVNAGDSAKWRLLLDALDKTLATWIAPQHSAVRAVDAKHPITVGYSDMILAKLGANNVLDFQSLHRYPGKSVKEIRLLFGVLQNIRASFPSHPLVLEEFGYSNDATSPATSSIYETALYLYLWKERMGGGAKWMLNDLASGWDARQMNLGMYRADGSAKPIVAALHALSSYIQRGAAGGGSLNIEADPTTGIRYVYSASDALFISAADYADQRLRIHADGPSQLFVSWSNPSAMLVSSTARATIRLNPVTMTGDAGIPSSFALEVLRQGGGTAHPFTVENGFVSFTAEAGETYTLKLPRSAVDARIQIVWPQGNKPVSQAVKANIGAYLFEQGTSKAICSSWAPTVRLWRALNNGIEEEVGIGSRAARAATGQGYNIWEFNDVDVKAANDPVNKYYFRLSVDGAPSERGNVWSHGEDARTYFPKQDVPSGVGTAPPQGADAKIEIVWPHSNLPVDKASKANIAAFLFEPGSTRSVAASWNPVVRLWRGLNNESLEPVAVGQKEMKTVGTLTFPTWTFNDVDVSSATNPANRYYFRVTVDSVSSKSNVWSHGVDARTYYPTPKAPEPNNGC